MLPVQVTSASASRCRLWEASALLQRFLSSDTCSDSLAREYVANIAQALQDTKSGICGGGPESPGHTGPSPPHSRLHGHAKESVPSRCADAHSDGTQSLPSAEDADKSLKVESVLPGAEHGSERHKKKCGLLEVENGFERDLLGTSDVGYAALVHHDKKKRKREEHETEPESVMKELYGSDNQSHHDKKRRKEEQQMGSQIVETDHLAIINQRFDGKKRRKKEKQGKDMEDMETRHVPENMGSPVSLSLAKGNTEVSYMNANNVKVSATPMCRTMEELAGLSKRKRKEGKMFPLASESVGKEREGIEREVSLIEFENLDTDAKKKTTKKKRRNKIGE